MGVRFGDNPTVSTMITIKYGGEAEKDEHDHMTWYETVSTATNHRRVRVENTSSQAGYQYNFSLQASRLVLGNTLFLWRRQREKHFRKNPILSSSSRFLSVPLCLLLMPLDNNGFRAVG